MVLPFGCDPSIIYDRVAALSEYVPQGASSVQSNT